MEIPDVLLPDIRDDPTIVACSPSLGIGNGVGKEGRGNQPPYRRYGPDTEIQYRPQKPHGLAKPSRILSKTLTLQPLLVWKKARETPKKKARVFLSWEKKGKTRTNKQKKQGNKNRENAQKKQGKKNKEKKEVREGSR